MDNNNMYEEYEIIEEEPKKKNVCGLLSFIFALVSLLLILLNCGSGMLAGVLGLIPFIGTLLSSGILILSPIVSILSTLLTIAGVILGIVGVTRRGAKKGLAIAGLIISGLMFIIEIVMTIILIVTVGGVAAVTILGGGIIALESLLEQSGF